MPISNIFQKSCINCQRMSPGRNCVILSAGFRKKNSFLTVRSTTVSPNCAFLPCMSCTDHGILHSSPCAGLILIFLMSLPRKKSGILSSLFQTLNIRLSFPSCTPPASGSGKSVPCVTKISAVLPCVYISAIPKRVLTGMPSFHKKLWIS